MPVIDRVLWIATAALSAGVLLKLYRESLLARYRAFAIMLAVGLLRETILACFPFTRAYTIAWVVTLPFLLDAQGAAAVNCDRQLSDRYPSIGQQAARLFARCLGFAALGCLVTLPLEWRMLTSEGAWVRIGVLASQWIDGLAAGGLALAVVFLARFPAPLPRVPQNLQIHTALLGAYFAAYSITFAAKNFVPWGRQWFEPIHMGVVAALYLGWLVGMKASGERTEGLQTVARCGSPARSMRLLDRLRKHDLTGRFGKTGGLGNRVKRFDVFGHRQL